MTMTEHTHSGHGHGHEHLPHLLEEAWEEFEHEPNAKNAAWFVIMMVMHNQYVYWSDKLRRLICAAEVYDKNWEERMKKVTEALGIKTWEEYVQVKNKYNLTQY